MTYTDINGIPFDDTDIERWAAEAEAGFPNSILEKVEPRAWEHTTPMQAKSVRMPINVWELVAQKAQKDGLSVSSFIRLAVSKELLNS